MNTPETEPTPPNAPTERQGVDRGDWSRVRIPGGEQGRPRQRRRHPEPHPDNVDAVESEAVDDFDAYDQTTSV